TNNEYFLTPAQFIIDYCRNQRLNGRKSITLKKIKEYSYQIKPGFAPRIPYLQVVDQQFLEGDYSHDE
ncbi:Holliday junction resolvase RecU, partial [Acinetobacter baumannii]|nr:Holliday junction resolvase RecU [Acinetobacter baumannii]